MESDLIFSFFVWKSEIFFIFGFYFKKIRKYLPDALPGLFRLEL